MKGFSWCVEHGGEGMGGAETRGPHYQPPFPPEAGVERMLRALMMLSVVSRGNTTAVTQLVR